MGGMAALIPVAQESQAHERALDGVCPQDKNVVSRRATNGTSWPTPTWSPSHASVRACLNGAPNHLERPRREGTSG